ncbi:MAG: hypothetical protein SGARI_006426 [Bacillariaceae sp.]
MKKKRKKHLSRRASASSKQAVKKASTSSKRAVMAGAAVASTAAAAVYAKASSRRLEKMKQKQAKEALKKKKSVKKSKKKKTGVLSRKLQDSENAQRDAPPNDPAIRDKVNVMTLAVPTKKNPEEEENLSSIDNSSETGSDTVTETEDDDDETEPTQEAETGFFGAIFGGPTNAAEEEDEGNVTDYGTDLEDEDTVMEAQRLKNERGLIMSPNTANMNISDDHINHHSWASAMSPFGNWNIASQKNVSEDDARDLRIMESYSSGSSGSYDEEDIPTDLEDFLEDDGEDGGSWYDDDEEEDGADDEDSWDVASMFKLHRNPSNVYVREQ